MEGITPAMSMISAVWVVDTNVVVSGLISSEVSSPPALILDAMLDGKLVYLMSEQLLNEYSTVLRRENLVRLHGLNSNELELLLAELVANAMWRKPAAAHGAPDPGDQHLWNLLAAYPKCRLLAGDQVLLKKPPAGVSVVSPRQLFALPDAG